VLTSLGVIVLAVSKIEEGRELTVGFQDHVSTFSPVAAVGAPSRNEFLTSKADATVSSISGLDEDFRFINKSNRSNSPSWEKPPRSPVEEWL
jgi:hypothetical protein